MKHTSGPWTFLEADYLDEASGPFTIGGGPNNDDIANVYSKEDATVSISREEAAANARLISAAPDMVEALIGAAEALYGLNGHIPNSAWHYEWQSAVAALKKARGEGWAR